MVSLTATERFLFLLINTCNCFFHAPLHKVVPSYIIQRYDADFNVKSAELLPHQLVNLLHAEIDGNINMGYYISIGVGTPPQKFNFIIDTGSSNVAVTGIPQEFVTKYFNSSLSSSFVSYGIEVAMLYGSGSWSGSLSSDVFTFDKTFTSEKTQIKVKSNFTVIKSTKTFFRKNCNWEGILGLAYSTITQPRNQYTLFDNFVQATRIPDLFSVALCGYRQGHISTQTHGYFIVGGGNRSLFVPPLVNIKVVRRRFYEIIISDISILNKSILSNCMEYNYGSTIIDTGTSDTFLPINAFRALIRSIRANMGIPRHMLLESSPFWQRNAILCTSPKHKYPPPIYFPVIYFNLVINDTAYVRVALSPQQYIVYVGNQRDIFGNERSCFKFGFGESEYGAILGNSFMEGFYFVFNRAEDTIGIAQSKCNIHYAGMVRSKIINVYNGHGGLLSCSTNIFQKKGSIDYFIAGVVLLVALSMGVVFLLVIIVIMILQQWYKNDSEQIDGITPNGTMQYKTFD